MAILQTLFTYFLFFVTIYIEIFMLTVFFSRRREIKEERVKDCDNLKSYPTVTLVVPCFNEEKTVENTLKSIMDLDYPQDKLKIIVVDDGSKDSTWSIIQKFAESHPMIEAIHKENGGKFTAINFAIEKSNSEFIGCLDSDSFVHPKSLKKIMRKFEECEDTMAVTPSIQIFKPNSMVQFVQKAEYQLAVLAKKVQSFLGAIHVTPGPFTIFKKEVFEKIGPFRHGHNLEDMEMAFRMQKNHMTIENVHHAWVYTVGPNTLKKLFKQRLRWTHGFIENAKDYKEMFLNPKYGNVSLLTLPTALIFIIAVVFTVSFFLWRLFKFLYLGFIQWKTVGFVIPHFSFSWFYVSAKLNMILGIVILALTLILMLNAQKLVDGHFKPGRHILYYFVIYPLISPFWVLKSIYNSLLSKKTSWR